MKQAPVLLLMIGLSYFSSAQQTRFLNDPHGNIQLRLKNFFRKNNTACTYPLLKDLQLKLRETDRSNDALNYQEIRYYATVCALKQNEERAAFTAQEFVDLEDNASLVQSMSFHLAEYYYRKQDFSKAIRVLRKSNDLQFK